MRLPIVDVRQPINWASSLNRGLVSWYLNLPMGQWGRGTLWRDLNRRYDGTLINATTWIGPYGRPGGYGSIRIAGGTDDVESGTVAMGAATEATIAFWVHRPTAGGEHTAGLNVSQANRFNILWFADNNLYYEVNGGYHYVSSTLTGWHHLALVYNNTETPKIRCYLDGKLQTTTVGGAISATSIQDAPIWIGREAANEYGTLGGYDDFRLYSRQLSDGEVLALYNASRAGYPNELRWVQRWNYTSVFQGGALIGTWQNVVHINADREPLEIVSNREPITISRGKWQRFGHRN